MKRDQGVVDWLKSGEWRAVPAALAVFFGFSIVVTILDFWAHFIADDSVYAPLVKYVGWSPGNLYMFSIIIGISLCLTRRLRTRNWLVGLLAFWALFNAIQFAFERHGSDFSNPYLAVSPYRPIWTVVVPLVWGALLMTPRVTKFCVREEPTRRKGATTA
jgi:hypothetical protein